jgi:hypothetical protein
MNRATFIEKLTEVQKTIEQLLGQLQASESDKFAAHLYQSRREYRHVCDRAGKGGNQIERCVISTFHIARRAWASMATIAPGSTCCGFTSESAIA